MLSNDAVLIYGKLHTKRTQERTKTTNEDVFSSQAVPAPDARFC